MFLSADALDILAYLRTAPGKFFSMPEISRRAAGRRRFEECPAWARNQMGPLLDAGLVQINARGHYCVPNHGSPSRQQPKPPSVPARPRAKTVGRDCFPEDESTGCIVGGDYFPPLD